MMRGGLELGGTPASPRERGEKRRADAGARCRYPAGDERTGTAGIELELFGTGARQHVFVRAGGLEPEWVYKLPAAYGYVVPFEVRLRKYRPANLLKRLLHRLLFVLPACLHDCLAGHEGGRRRKVGRVLSRAANRAYRLFCHVRNRPVAAVYRYVCRREFARMLGLMDHLSRCGADDVLLPFRVVEDGEALLRVDGCVRPYRGPILVQRRARFFNASEAFDEFEVRDLTSAQQRLWEHGVGLTDATEILGPKNWALFGRRLRLADTSSLTCSYRRARNALNPSELDAKMNGTLRRLKGTDSYEAAVEYFRFVRAEVCEGRLGVYWRSSLP